jgi:serine/threonine-protein kinase
MSKPVTLNATVALVRKSQLVPEDRLTGFLSSANAAPLAELTPTHLLDRMVAHGLLTKFQAEQLQDGRHHGFILGSYRILERIGKGGMGQIYLAEHAELGRRVAIKVLRPSAESTPLARERFLREATAAAKLDHPNIVAMFDVFPDADPPYLVMEHIEGVSLQAAVARNGPLTPADAAECGRQIALGLAHAAAAGLVHRDVKPANVLVDQHGVAKVLDLGIVHVIGETLTKQVDTDMILGTVEYLAPEQAYSSQVDARADIYGLGATLYFLLTGRPPFPDGDVRTKILKLYSADPDPLTAVRPDLPPGLAAVVHRMLAKHPDDRFQAADDAAAALAPWASRVGFPDRLFDDMTTTVSDQYSQTDLILPEYLQPPPGTPAPPADGGTVDLDEAMRTTQPDHEQTLRTQLDRATAEAGPLPPAADRGRLVSWAVVALVVLILGGFTLWALLTAP